MAQVRATCPACGTVELTGSDVQVQVCLQSDEKTYSFQCPTCRKIVNKPVSQKTYALLVDAGIRVINWDMPAELYEPKIGPPFTCDNLIDFHFELEDDGWLNKLLMAPKQEPR